MVVIDHHHYAFLLGSASFDWMTNFDRDGVELQTVSLLNL